MINETQQQMLQAARTFVERLFARAKACNDVPGMGPLTRGFDDAARRLAQDIDLQVRAFRDNALTNADGQTVDKS